MAVWRSIPDSIADTLPELIINDIQRYSLRRYFIFLCPNFGNRSCEPSRRIKRSNLNCIFPFFFYLQLLKKLKVDDNLSPIVKPPFSLSKIRRESGLSNIKFSRRKVRRQSPSWEEIQGRRRDEGCKPRKTDHLPPRSRLSSRSGHSTIYASRINHLQCRILQINQCQLLRAGLNEKR